ncbi:MAG: hypothetical protein AAF433_12025 [Bacteroidota bacterium]
MLGESSANPASEEKGLSQVALQSLRTSGAWARFIGITGLILMGIFLLRILLNIFNIGPINGDEFLQVFRMLGGLFTVLIISYLLIIVFQVIYYFKTLQFGRDADVIGNAQSEQGIARMLDNLWQSFRAQTIFIGGTVFIFLFILIYFYWNFYWMLNLMK